MATPTPTPTPTPQPLHAKPGARKLPIKRRTPQPQPQPQPQAPSSSSSSPHIDPINPDPTALDHVLKPHPTDPDRAPDPKPERYEAALVPAENGYEDEDEEEDEGEEEEEEEEEIDYGAAAGLAAGSGGDELRSPPFKFHRIWSESDEIRFLQGLLGCWSQGMVFPRDLNLFYDRFSESMPQPYTRSQLSEKLRRLRKKFRIMSGRIARGQDPSRLAPHDRDLLHLCTRLWHPSYASSSPFSSPDSPAAGGRNKRRRPNPRAPSAPARSSDHPLPLPPSPPSPVLPPPPPPPPPPPAATPKTVVASCPDDGNLVDVEVLPAGDDKEEHAVKVEPVPVTVTVPLSVAGAVKEEPPAARTMLSIVLDVFDEQLKEVRTALVRHGLLFPDLTLRSGADASDLEKRWREQRAAELDVLARRLRLVLENAIQG